MENNNEKRIKLIFNKKVISISFLALALFMLLAVSYAYFTATVTGNESAKKTTITTGTMALKLYGEDIVSLDNAIPGNEYTIEFRVENTGNVEAKYHLDIINVINTFEKKEELVYTIESDNNGGTKEETIAPSSSGHLIEEEIKIAKGKTQKYTMTIKFLETHSNQNYNQEKMFSGKIQIDNTNDELAATILKNNPLQTMKPLLYYASPYCNDNTCSSTTDNGTGLFAAPDDDGTSYYFRGAVTNNNVKFAGMKWKIIRTNGDGSVRLILNENNGPEDIDDEEISYTVNNTHDCTTDNPCVSDYKNGSFVLDYGTSANDSKAKNSLEKWYKEKLAKYDSQIALAWYCNDTSISSLIGNDYAYGIYRPDESLLLCPNPTYGYGEETHDYGGVYKLKIGLITRDEMYLAGFGSNVSTPSISSLASFPKYLKYSASETNYLYCDVTEYGVWASMTPKYYELSSLIGIFKGAYGYIETVNTTDLKIPLKVRPVINLKSNVSFTGDGTEEDPYTIQ